MSAGRTRGSTDIVAQAQDSGRVATAWESVTTVAARSVTPKPLVDAVNTAKAFFSGPLADERATLARALSSDQKPAVALAKFQSHVTPDHNIMNAIANPALNQSQLRTQRTANPPTPSQPNSTTK